MAKLPSVSGPEAVRKLKRLGMEDVHQNGGHVFIRNPATEKMTQVPCHGSKTIKKPTLKSILRRLDVSVQAFCDA